MPLDRLTTIAALALTAGCLPAAGAFAQAEATQPAEAQPEPTEKPAADLPDGFDVLERHIEASGGAEAGLALEGIRMAGDFTMPAMGMGGKITISMKAPTSQVILVDLGPMGSVVQGTNGEVAWASEPGQQPKQVFGPQADQLIEQSDFHGRYKPREQYESATTTGVEEIDGERYYRVVTLSTKGTESVGLYSVRTGLQHKELTRRAPGSDLVVSDVTFSDYRGVGDGLVMPFKLRIEQGGFVQEIAFTEITADPDFEPGLFEPPGEN